MCINYEEFLKTKAQAVPCCGFSVAKDEMNPAMFEWQKDIAGWAFKKGKAALSEDCGLGKTIQQLEWTRIVAEKTGEPCLTPPGCRRVCKRQTICVFALQ